MADITDTSALTCGMDDLEAHDAGAVKPVAAREVVYQGTAYLGIGRTRPFFSAMNEVFAERGVELPLPAQDTTTLYTRGGLSDLDREMVTFCYLVAQGGCEPQATAHAGANLRLGRTKDFLYRVVMQILPYIGYPRSLNALSCIDNAAKQ